jgi:hypothetical protein
MIKKRILLILALLITLPLAFTGCAGFQVVGSGSYTGDDGTIYSTEWDGTQWRTCVTNKEGQKVCIGVAPTRQEAVQLAKRHDAVTPPPATTSTAPGK